MLTLTPSEIIELYRNGLGVGSIAKKLNTYPSKIFRLLKEHEEPLRNKSEAQKTALEVGTALHPTKGKKRSQEEKNKIGQSVSETCQSSTPEEKQRRSEIAKDNWKNMDFEQKQKLFKKAAKAIRKATSEGSILEKFLHSELNKAGYESILHKKRLVASNEMELDLYIPAENLVIEVDGPSHFLPVYGEETLAKRRKSDSIKNGMLLNAGLSIIRLRYTAQSMTEVKKRQAWSVLLEAIGKIESNQYMEVYLDK